MMNDISTFIVIALFLVISPGPNIALIIKTVSSDGKIAGFFNVLGFVLAAFIHGALSVLGLSAIIVQSAELFFIVKIIGAIYLLYLGVKTIYQSYKTKTPKVSTTNSKAIDNRVIDTKNALKSFGEGFLTQMLNPKGSMFYLAVFPQFIDFQSHAYFEAFTLVSIHAGLMTLWFGSACIIASNFKQKSGESKLGLWVQRFSGGILIVFSMLLLKQEAR